MQTVSSPSALAAQRRPTVTTLSAPASSRSTATSTTIYPFKWYSVASSTGSGAKYATTTEYIFNGDTLLSTSDQQFASGVATGTAQTSYIHADHLGSTNVVTNASGTVVQTLDYYPYGSPKINTGVAGPDSQRKYIGQYYDATGLSYMNARYYSPAQGQFISQDPVFWEIGLTQDGRNALANRQTVHAYAYSADNPITNKDPSGRITMLVSRPIANEGFVSAIGGHTFLLVLPNNNSSVGTMSGIDTSKPFTLAGYANPNTGMLYKSYPSDSGRLARVWLIRSLLHRCKHRCLHWCKRGRHEPN